MFLFEFVLFSFRIVPVFLPTCRSVFLPSSVVYSVWDMEKLNVSIQITAKFIEMCGGCAVYMLLVGRCDIFTWCNTSFVFPFGLSVKDLL